MSSLLAHSYSQIRLAWFKARLTNFLKRWAIYISIGVIVIGGSLNGTLALMSLLVAPLLQAPQQPLFQALLICVGYGFVGGLIVLGLSPFLLPPHWGEAERALPIERLERVKSDLLVVVLGLSPLIAVYSLGFAIWLIKFPLWLQAHWFKSLLFLTSSVGLSIFFGLVILNYRRNLSPVSNLTWPFQRTQNQAGNLSQRQTSVSNVMALVVLPLLRGSAKRSAMLFVMALVLLCSCVLVLLILPTWGSWALAAFAVFSQVLVSRLNIEMKLEMTLIKEACAHLPVRTDWLNKALRYFVLIPHLIGIVLLSVALTVSQMPLRFSVLICFLLFSFLGNLALIVLSSKPPKLGQREDPSAQVSWWLLILVISIALSTEVLI
jgi:hypothetical protein